MSRKKVIVVCDSLNIQPAVKYLEDNSIHALTVITSSEIPEDLGAWDVLWSFHCKRILKTGTLSQLPCINIHPGLNPFNRGIYPHIFSIIDGQPTGATIHYIDAGIDSGPIIRQQAVDIRSSDTSKELHDRITATEIELLKTWFDPITSELPEGVPAPEGNINYMKDFLRLCALDLTDRDTLHQHINKLRALSHGEHHNAFFYDEDGRKVFVRLTLEKEK